MRFDLLGSGRCVNPGARAHARRRRALPAICLAACAGCATVSVERIPPQEGVYPASTAPDAPLVLAIPGLRIPTLLVTQEQHFGHLVGMLAAEGIPCRILTYDTRENPLSPDAALVSPDLAIAWTRVGPAAVHELQIENERREALGLPGVRRVVFFGYSQGAVIMEQIASRIFYSFKNDYEEMAKRFGPEWTALRNDPEFLYFMNALEDYLVLKNIKVQREKQLRRDPDFKFMYRRAEMKVHRQFDELIQYLNDPSAAYPHVSRFEEPETPKYPKRYRAMMQCADYNRRCSPEERARIMGFFVDYAEYRYFLDVEPAFVAAAGSFFGSPRANDSSALLSRLPFLKPLARRELKQIRQTELGAPQHWENIETLARLNKDERYPIDPDNTLFIVGANGARGDGLVDQASAHLADHSFQRVLLRAAPGGAGWGAAETIERCRLPDLIVVPLRVAHFPEKVMAGLGGRRWGAAYMEKGNPAWPYLLGFVRCSSSELGGRIARGEKGLDACILASIQPPLRETAGRAVSLRQFMLELSLPPAIWRGAGVSFAGRSANVRIDRLYHNPESRSWVWTGHFEGKGQEMNPFGPESAEGAINLLIRPSRGAALPLACAVYPGCSSFVKIEL